MYIAVTHKTTQYSNSGLEVYVMFKSLSLQQLIECYKLRTVVYKIQSSVKMMFCYM